MLGELKLNKEKRKDKIEKINEEKKVFGLNENLFFTGLTSFLTDTSVNIVYPVLPVFLTSVLGSSVESVSIIEGVAESTSSVLKALSGLWSDKIGKNKPFMLFGYLMTTIITPFFGYVGNWRQVLLMRFSERVGKGVRTAPRDSIIAASGGKKGHGKSFGFHKAMDNSGAILGPLIAFIVLKLTMNNYKTLFLLATIPAFLGVATISLFIKEGKSTNKKDIGKVRFKDFSKQFYLFLLIAFIFSLGNSTDTLLLLRAEDSGFLGSVVPLLYLIFNFSSVIFAIPIGIISDKLGREKIIIAGYILYAAVYLGFAYINTKLAIVLLFMLYGLYSASTDGIQKALVADLIGDKHRGTGLGLYNSIIGITLLPASVIGGVMWNNYNHSLPFLFGAILAFAASALLYIFYRSNHKLTVY